MTEADEGRWRTRRLGRRQLLGLLDQPGDAFVWSPVTRGFVRAYKYNLRRHVEDAPRGATWQVKLRLRGRTGTMDVYLQTRLEAGRGEDGS